VLLRPVDAGVLVLALGALIGVLALTVGSQLVLLVLAVLAGGAVLVATLLRPAVALVLLVVSEFSNAGVVLPIPQYYSITLVLGVLSALLALRRPEMRDRLRNPPWMPVALLACYLGALLPSTWGTMTPAATSELMVFLVKDCLVLLVVLLLAPLVERPWWIAGSVVVTLAVISAMTVINQVALGAQPVAFGGFATISPALGEDITTPRHAGPLPDSNFWGRNLVLGLPFAYALMHRAAASGRRANQAGWGLATVTMLGGIYLTQSRGTFLAALVVSVVWVVASGPQVRRRALMLTPLLLLVLLVPGVGNRLVGLTTAFESAPAYTIDPSLVERSAAQEIAALILADRPLFGAGPGSFPEVVLDYATRTDGALIGNTSAPHNVYLEIGAESGLVGLAGWLAMMIGTVLLAVRSLIRLAGMPQDGLVRAPTRPLAASVVAGLVGWSLASLFLHLEFFRPLLIVFALAGLLYTSTRDLGDRQPAAAAEASAAAARGLRDGSIITVAAVLAAGTVMTQGLLTLGEPQYRVQARFTLLPAPDTYPTYSIDVRRRVPVLPAYAGMIQSAQRGTGVHVDAEPASGLITMTAHGVDRAATENRINRAIGSAAQAVHEFGGDRAYRLVQVSPVEATVEQTWSDIAITLTALAVLSEAIVIVFIVRYIRKNRPNRRASRE
jgi:O-antigen ligase